jgi:imidazolonepropionase-like amidohydrolase
MSRTLRAGALALAGCLTPALATTGPARERVEAGTLRLHYLRNPIGYERYELTRAGASLQLDSAFDFKDRGGRVQLATSLLMKADLTPERFETQGKTYRFVKTDAAVEIVGREAAVKEGTRSTRVVLPDRFFTASGYAPFAVQMMLMRYWKEHGRPRVISTVPGDPLNVVEIEQRGEDALLIGGASVRLERYSVSGLTWGRETLWLDSSNRLAAVATWACGLAFEAVREEYEPGLAQLLSKAVQDQMADLERLSARIEPTQRGAFALVGGTLIDGTRRAPIADSVVVVEAGRITAAGPRSAVIVPPAARTVDVTGETLIPGLWDMHTHVAHAEWGPLYLAAGVTSIRDMGGEFEFLTALRDALESGRGLGPKLLLAGLVDGGGPDAFGVISADTAEEARGVVARYHGAGFQQIKLYDLLQPAIVAALASEAHRLGITVTGHVPRSLTLREAVEAGMDQIAHLPITGDPDSAAVKSTVEFLRRHGTVLDPVVSWNELLGRSSTTPVAAFQPGILKAPYPVAELFLNAGVDGLDPGEAHARLEHSLAILRALHAAGVPIVAGTDEGVPGHSLHREIELYVEAGLTPLEAIRAATAVPARVMGMEGEVGTIEVGKRADLVVLGGNPLETIANIRAVRSVISQGRMYDCGQLWRVAGFRP